MEYRIRLATDVPDLAVITDALQQADPAAIVDRDPRDGSLRATVWMDGEELRLALAQVGYPPIVVEQQASNCCGECSG
ncbi:MAG: hypothetical protein IT472_07745 [Thermomonas sp.]|uniref:hypothetical protein n=1 Tax=Thermomonas sp. TaxID=1971895 RepID=UPI00260DED89|nr:hypothetical protein [Thermomonas sp.]MCC7097055.1 hypothetical protein [Thermomonas sp.]